tara:strand:+ start:4363 stop:4947 length:585 start_codon:yes stop_codon:yes gene_type:complete
MKKVLLFAALCLATVRANAGLLQNVNYLTDTNSGLDWLYLSETVDRSANDIQSSLQAGGDLYGWTLATFNDLTNLYDAAGGTGPYNNTGGHQTAYNALVTSWGAASDHNRGDEIWAHLSDASTYPSIQDSGVIFYSSGYSRFSTAFSLSSSQYNSIGHALYRTSSFIEVSEPGSLALLGLGVIGLGYVRKKNQG